MSDLTQVRVLQRAFLILDVIKHSKGGIGITGISRETGLSKSTVFRLLATLTSLGYTRKDDVSDRYSFGFKLIDLSFSAFSQWDLVNLATPYLEQLKFDLNETTALAIKNGIYYSFIAQSTCTHEYRVNPILGEKYFLHLAGTGKAILAFSTKEDISQIADLLPDTVETENTIKDPGHLALQLNEIRAQGFASSFSERIEGGASYSAPIRDASGLPRAAISIIGPEIRLRKMDKQMTGECLKKTALQLESIYRISGVSMDLCEQIS